MQTELSEELKTKLYKWLERHDMPLSAADLSPLIAQREQFKKAVAHENELC